MSKVGKWVKKTFKKVVKVVKKVIVPIAAIAAVVWTAGAALGAFAPASALAQSAIGQGLISASGAIGSAVSTAWSAVTRGVSAATAKVQGMFGFQGGLRSASEATLAQFRGADAGMRGFGAASNVAGGAGAGGGGGMFGGSSGLAKAALASSVIGGLTEPTPDEMAEAQAKGRRFQGSFYGNEAGGGGEVAPSQPLRVPGQPVAEAPADIFSSQVQPTSPLAPRPGSNLRPRVGVNPADLFGGAYA